MGGLLDLHLSGFREYGDAGNFKPSAGAARACAGEHQQYQYPLAVLRPDGVIHRAEAGGADNGGHIEIAVPQGEAEAPVELADTQRDGKHRRGDDPEIPVQLLVFYYILSALYKQQKIEVEVHAEEDHKCGGDKLNIEAVKGGDAGGFCREAARAGGGKGMQQRVIKAHAAAEEKHRFGKGERNINKVKYGGGLPRAGDELTHGRAGHLGTHDVHGMLVAVGQHRHDEHQHAHAAYPVGKLPPEHIAPRHGLNIVQNRRAGSGEAGDGLKNGVKIIGDAPAYHKGQRADKRHQYPAQPHNGKAVTGEKAAVPRPEQAQQSARRGGDGDAYRKIQHIFPVAQPRDKR